MESIELNRICATLESFPVHDRLVPHLMDDTVDVHRQFAPFESTRQKRNDHLPYSPGFLLPLILGALKEEVSAPKPRAVFHSSAIQTSITKQERLLAQRFCDKGALALALASLSCKCPTLRKISLGILGLLTDAVNRPDAHISATWKDRPQISMLLNAVQRAFVLRFCDDPFHKETPLFDVPELPGFPALFLAKASLILPHPGDPLYTAINRAFLRSENDAGGFQDLTRLPVFVSLFCSAADTPDQLTAERKFAIALVKDGFVDGGSHKLLVQCHCIELLMTSIESSLMRPSACLSDELSLLLDALTKILALGGASSASHLLNRLGLVSWICALLCGKPIITDQQAVVGLFTLLLEVFKVARANEAIISKEDFVITTSGVAQVVISISLNLQNERGSLHSKESSQVISLACQVLTVLTLSFSLTDLTSDLTTAHYFVKHTQPDGLRLQSAIQFLSQTRYLPKQLGSALFAVSCLPVRCDSEPTELVQLFCEQILETFTFAAKSEDDLRFVILHRIRFLAKSIDENKDKRMDILRYLLQWRSDCNRTSKLRRMWYSCLEALAISNEEECNEFNTCLREEVSLSAWVLGNSPDICIQKSGV